MIIWTDLIARSCIERPTDIHKNKVPRIVVEYEHHSERGSKNPKLEFSRINSGGSMSAISTCCIDLEMSSTVNGMLDSIQIAT